MRVEIVAYVIEPRKGKGQREVLLIKNPNPMLLRQGNDEGVGSLRVQGAL